jgi:hypothetical protein
VGEAGEPIRYVGGGDAGGEAVAAAASHAGTAVGAWQETFPITWRKVSSAGW